MRVLTPSGYRSPVDLANGAEVCAFGAQSGAPIVNHVENIDVVDYAEWCRWWQVEEAVPAFNWIRINDAFLLFGEQSIWRNGSNVCHAKHLVIGDEIYDDADQPVTITSIEIIEDASLIWYRFTIDGDHSYIIDGLAVHNASRYWVGGTGTWDNSTTTHWAASSGGVGGQSVPASSDDVWIDGSSGGGTITPNYGGTITIASLILWGGTFDNSVNNNNITLTGQNGLNGSSFNTRSILLGSATYTLTAHNANYEFSTTSNLTFSGSASTVIFSGSSSTRVINAGGLSHGHFSIGPSSGIGYVPINGNSSVFASLDVDGPNLIQLGSNISVTAALNWSNASSGPVLLTASSPNSAPTIGIASGSVADWCGFRGITFTGATLTANSSFDFGNNSGVAVTPPGSGGGGISRARAFGGV